MLKKTTFILAVAVSCVGTTSMAGVVLISLGDFTNAKVLDFESVSTGNISGTDSLFTNFGISSVATTSSSFSDTYGSRPNSSRALWENSNGLAIVDPGTQSLADTIQYVLNFSEHHTRFGLGRHDQFVNEGDAYEIEFFSGATNVGSISFSAGGADLTQEYFESTSAFDRVVINDGNMSGGFAIDNLTLEEASVVPEPTSLTLLGIGAIGLFGYGWRRKRTPVV